MNHAERLATAFVATFAVIVLAATVAGFVATDGAAPAPEIENEHFTDENLTHDRTPGEADVTMSSTQPPRTVLVDPGIETAGTVPANPLALLGLGGPDVADRDIRPLANALIENGHEVRVHTPPAGQPTAPRPGATRPAPNQNGAEGTQIPLDSELEEADAFVTFDSEYSAAEREAIESFVDGGGTVVSMTDPDEAFDQPGAAAFDSTLGVSTEPGYVYNLAENDLNYQRVYAEPAGDSALTDGVDRAVFPTATPVGAAGGEEAFRPIDGSQLSTSRAPTDAPLLVENGGVIKIGDADFLSPENAQRADNDVLIGNLADALVTSGNGGARPPVGSESTQTSSDADPTDGPDTAS
ncbi:hypothetical protein [Natronomonas sp. LN261]|uniref:hypothetical protein n=1 Tax=Natronomonas sp. LN261 TaxID=2750669 RepID=UPI0015EE6FAC|nr:hypothetical protein [Natronomonas sp. LN261]